MTGRIRTVLTFVCLGIAVIAPAPWMWVALAFLAEFQWLEIRLFEIRHRKEVEHDPY